MKREPYERGIGSGNWNSNETPGGWASQPPAAPAAPATPAAAAHAAFYAAAYVDGAARTPSPPAIDEAEAGNSGNWGGQQGSGNWGGWWGGIQGRGNWGGKQGSGNHAPPPHAAPPPPPPPPPTPTVNGAWAPPPLRTGWGIRYGRTHVRDPLWEPYVVEWHRRDRDGERQLTWNQFVEWTDDGEPMAAAATVRPAGHHPSPPPPTSPPLPAAIPLPLPTPLAAAAASAAAAAINDAPAVVLDGPCYPAARGRSGGCF